jgi:hypothetical protein
VTYRWLTDLDQALAAGGVPFTPIMEDGADATGSSSWATRGRPTSTGAFEPEGVLCHHTASPAGTSDRAELNVILRGNSEAPGPISQLFIGRSATVYLVAAGRANHGGRGAIPGQGCDDMNARLVGIEAGNSGVGERWSDALCDIYARTVRALTDWYGWHTSAVYFHATTGPPCGNHKIDPAGPWTAQPHLPGGSAGTWDLPTWRAFIDSTAGGAVPPEPPPGDDMAIMIIQSTDADAAFLGYVTPGPYCLQVQWADRGMWDRWTAVGTPVIEMSTEQIRSMMLLGPFPQGDSRKQWGPGDFAAVVQ